MSVTQAPEPRTFKGKTLAAVLQVIREELGENAVALNVSEGRTGGFAGFFARRCVVVEAIAGPTVDAVAGDDEDFHQALAAANAAELEAEREAARAQRTQERRLAFEEHARQLLEERDRRERGEPEPTPEPVAVAPEPEPVAVAADVPDTWDQLIEEARRRATAPAPAAPAASGPSESASRLAAMFSPDGDDAPAPAEPEPVAVAPDPVVEPEPVPEPAPVVAEEPAPIFEPELTPVAVATVAAPEALPEIQVDYAEPTTASLLPDLADPVYDGELTSTEVGFPAYQPGMEVGVPIDAHWPELALEIHRNLTDRGMEPALVGELVSEAVEHLAPFSRRSLRPLVANQLARCMVPMPRRRPGRLVIGFVGAGGSGKTRVTARLALAYARRGNRPVACLTLRPKDRGAELLSAVGHAGIPVHAAADVAAARRFLDRVGDEALVIVDTPGVSPRHEAELARLAEELRELQLDECHLTLPATLSPEAAGGLVEGTRALGVDAIAITHLDETDHVGAAFGAALGSRLPISYVGRGTANGRAVVRPASVEALALELVG